MKNWNDCLGKFSAKKITPDIHRAISLRETAHERINLITDITKKNSNFVFEDYYTSLLELLQAKTFCEGYNVLNHICLGFYIRDILKDDYSFLVFDDLRYKRNSLTYYGIRMEFETALEAINKCKKLIKTLLS